MYIVSCMKSFGYYLVPVIGLYSFMATLDGKQPSADSMKSA